MSKITSSSIKRFIFHTENLVMEDEITDMLVLALALALVLVLVIVTRYRESRCGR